LDNAPVEEDELAWFEKTRQEKSSLTWGIWIVAPEGEEIEGQSRLLIGNTTLFGIDMEGHTRLIRQASSGSMIFRPEYHGKGIASAAHKARTWFAFTQLGLHRIKSAVIQANGASLTALKKSGYTLVYTERNEQFSDGKFHHLDCLENLNPLPMFWRQWWNQDRPSRAALEARDLTRSALEWASQNVKLL